jgi:DNA-binding NarL/FixJ family response regulator
MPRALIVDAYPAVRRGVRSFIAEQMRTWSCTEASTAGEALQHLSKHTFHIMIVALDVPRRGGLEFITDVHRSYPHTPILVFSAHAEEQFATRALRAGAAGYLPKHATREELIQAVQKIAAGGKYLRPGLAEEIVFDKVLPHRTRPLSNREFEVLRFIVSGKPLTQIARDLALSVKTISGHKRRIMSRLGVSNNAELIRWCIEQTGWDTTLECPPEQDVRPRSEGAQSSITRDGGSRSETSQKPENW